MAISEGLLIPTTLFAIVGCGLMSGLFFVFSNFAMQALADLPPEQGIAAMQRINARILNPLFLLIFLATPVACLLLLAIALLESELSCRGCLIAGSLAYLLGGLGVTAAFNVPRNNALDRVAADGPEAATAWGRYLREWTRWNHVRTLSCIAATALFVYWLASF